MAKTLEYIENHSLELAQVFSEWSIPFKDNVSLYSNASQYSGDIKACKKLACVRFVRPQTLLFVKFFYLNCKVFTGPAIRLSNV